MAQRSESLELEEAVRTIRTKCTQWLESPVLPQLFRSRGYEKVTAQHGFIITRPNTIARAARGHKHLMEMTRALPEWLAYPDRSRSIMCSNDREWVDSFSRSLDDSYVVVPFDNAVLGVCPSKDFNHLDTFSYTKEVLQLGRYTSADDVVNQLTSYTNESVGASLHALDDLAEDDDRITYFHVLERVLEVAKERGVKPSELLTEILSPARNGFTTQTYPSIHRYIRWQPRVVDRVGLLADQLRAVHPAV